MTAPSTGEIPLSSIVPPAFMLRDPPTPSETSELAASIRAHGLIEPIVVRPVANKFELVAGYRRYLACRQIHMQQLPAVINQLDDATAIILGLSENLDRKDASPMRMALAVNRLVEAEHMSTTTIGKKLGKAPEWVSKLVRLAKLTKFFQDAFQSPFFTLSHAIELLPIRSEEKLQNAIDEVVDKRLSFRETRKLVAKILMKPTKRVPTEPEEKGTEGAHGIPMTCAIDQRQHPPGQMVKVAVCRDHYETKIQPLLKADKDKNNDKER